jgi:hypothetical protein
MGVHERTKIMRVNVAAKFSDGRLVRAEGVTPTEFRGGFNLELSELGLRGFPKLVTFEGVAGAVFSFVNVGKDREGDVTHADYANAKGTALTLFND